MKNSSIEEIQEKYNLGLDKVILEIKKTKAKLVLLQFPDGLKTYATTIVDYLKEKTSSEFIVWIESCFGACDTPIGIDKLKPKVDLVIQFGHNELLPSYCKS